MAASRYTEALAIQRRFDDKEGSGLALGGRAQLAALSGDHGKAIKLHQESLAAFEAIGDRAEEARILNESPGSSYRRRARSSVSVPLQAGRWPQRYRVAQEWPAGVLERAPARRGRSGIIGASRL